jgi:hypothetical protein
MCDLLGAARSGEALAEVIADGQAAASRDLGREPQRQVSLPARAEDGVAVSGLVELELDETVEHGGAFSGARCVPLTTSRNEGRRAKDDDHEEHESWAMSHGRGHRKKWTRMGGESAAID